MKSIVLEKYKEMLNMDDMDEFVIHGTTKDEYKKILDNDFNVKNFYVTNDEDNAAEYAYRKNNDFPILLLFDTQKMNGNFELDIHDDVEIQEGQWIFTGNIKNSIVEIIPLY